MDNVTESRSGATFWLVEATELEPATSTLRASLAEIIHLEFLTVTYR